MNSSSSIALRSTRVMFCSSSDCENSQFQTNSSNLQPTFISFRRSLASSSFFLYFSIAVSALARRSASSVPIMRSLSGKRNNYTALCLYSSISSFSLSACAALGISSAFCIGLMSFLTEN